MLNTYCQHCGTKIEYRFQKPNFCTSCGQPLHSEAKTQTPQQETNARQMPQKEADLDPEGTDIFEVPNISSLEYDIEISQSSFSMGDLFKNVDTQITIPDSPRAKRGRPRKNNGKSNKD